MKIKFGAMVVDGRGKLGGHVASKNRGGAYFRTKVTPSNPNTTAQAAARARITLLSQGFGNLGAAPIAAWNGAVGSWSTTDIFGDIKNPSGINLFTKLNSNLIEIGEPVINTPPAKAAVPETTIDTITADSATQTLDLNLVQAALGAGTKVIVRASAQTSAGVANFSGKMRNIEIVSAVTAPNTLDIIAAYTTKFGALIAGQKLNVELVPVNIITGQKGAVSSLSVVVQ